MFEDIGSNQWWENNTLNLTALGQLTSEHILNNRFWQSIDEICYIFLAHVHHSSIGGHWSASDDEIFILCVSRDEEEVGSISSGKKMGCRHRG